MDGPQPPSAIGGLFAAAFGLPTSTVTIPGAPAGERVPCQAPAGRIEVHCLDAGDFRFKVDLDLFDAPIDVGRFRMLAERYGLTIAWCLDEALPNDWHYHVAFPDGTAEVHRLRWEEDGDKCGCFLAGFRQEP